MKEQDFKKHLKEHFEQKAPATFTANVMQNINATKTSYKPILSRTTIFISLSLLVILFVLIVSTSKTSSLNFNYSIITNVLASNVYLLVLPFNIMLLIFLREWFFYYRSSSNK